MKYSTVAALCATLCLSLQPLPSRAQEQMPDLVPELAIEHAADVTLDAFKWVKRVIVVFADSPLDPNFSEQISLLESRPEVLLDRDVVVVTDTDPDARSAIRTKLRPRGFALVIVDKDGRVMLRKPAPWDLREISRAIDKTPLRQQEIHDQSTGN